MGEDGSWSWRVVNPDGGYEESGRKFKTLKECSEDAARHGYVAWRSEEERRRGA